MEIKFNVKIVTDGACSGNPGSGGWAAILQCNGREMLVSGNAEFTTNNRMELQAVLEGLRALHCPCNVVVATDSAYIANQANGGWVRRWGEAGWKTASNKPVKNRDLWEAIAKEMKRHSVTFEKVRGHAGNLDNERADKEACKLRDEAKRGSFTPIRKVYMTNMQDAK